MNQMLIVLFNSMMIELQVEQKTEKLEFVKIDNVEENVKKKFYTMEEVLTDYPHGIYCLIQLKDRCLI